MFAFYGTTFIVMVMLASGQTNYVYPSHNASYLPGETFMVCSDCPAPTPKLLRAQAPVTTKQIQQQPVRIDPKKILPPQEISFKSETEKAPDPIPAPPSAPTKITLNFGYKSSKLSVCDKQKLDSIRQVASAPRATVSITGYTDKAGSKKYNDRLAMKRAKSVARYLGVQGTVIGKGKCCYMDQSNEMNRRVEVVVTHAAVEAKQKGGSI